MEITIHVHRVYIATFLAIKSCMSGQYVHVITSTDFLHEGGSQEPLLPSGNINDGTTTTVRRTGQKNNIQYLCHHL